MSQQSKNIFQFWQELKRRKVIRVIIGYLASAYIILELISIVAEPFGLPDWTLKLVFVLLAVGFILIVILSWIFDVTPEGIKKTESKKAMKDSSRAVPVRRKLKASDIIITILLIAVCVLIYPRIFNRDNLKDIRDEAGKISVAVMPFENLSGDSLLNIWQSGFQNLLISTLSNSPELQVRQYQTMSAILDQSESVYQSSISPSFARELAKNLRTRTYIYGKIMQAGENIRINAQLVNAETEEVYKTYQVDGDTEDDMFTMADSLSGMIKNYLEIKKLVEEYDSPEFNESHFTNSAEAFQYYIHSWDAFSKMDIGTALNWLLKAIEIDSNFVEAYVFLSFANIASLNIEPSKKWCNKAYEKRANLPVREKLLIDHLHAYHYETPWEEIRLCKQILEMDEMNTIYWHMLGDAYFRLNHYKEATTHWEYALDVHEKWGTNLKIPHLYIWMGSSYHELGNHQRENEIYDLGLQVVPNFISILRRQASCALSQGESEEGNVLIDRYISVRTALNTSESDIKEGIGHIFSFANQISKAEQYYREALALDPDNSTIINNLAWILIKHDINVNEGLELIEKALVLEPDDPYYLDTKGWGLYKQGKYEEALRFLQKAWDARIIYDQEIYEHLQEVERALAAK